MEKNQIFFTPAGQISGIALSAWGALTRSLIGSFWVPNFDHYQISVSFRGAGAVCSNATQKEEIGDRVVINQGGVTFQVPTNYLDAGRQNWTVGGCIEKMGRHWSYDLNNHPEESWKLDSLRT